MKRPVDSFLQDFVEDEDRMNFTIRLLPSFGRKLDELAGKLCVSRALLMRRFVEWGYDELREPLEAFAAARLEQHRSHTRAFLAKSKREAKS